MSSRVWLPKICDFGSNSHVHSSTSFPHIILSSNSLIHWSMIIYHSSVCESIHSLIRSNRLLRIIPFSSFHSSSYLMVTRMQLPVPVFSLIVNLILSYFCTVPHTYFYTHLLLVFSLPLSVSIFVFLSSSLFLSLLFIFNLSFFLPHFIPGLIIRNCYFCFSLTIFSFSSQTPHRSKLSI